jgi:dTDP-6-deoxy-L-talose 4-dehydrogenase (NAD+)
MKFAVTGASGFLGRHVVAALAGGAGVASLVAVSRHAESVTDWPPGVRALNLDLASDKEGRYEALGRPDVLLHLAWSGLPNYQSLDHFEVQLGQHYRFLKRLVSDGLPSLLVTGTCLEYGLKEGELGENLSTDPVTPYGLAKDVLRRQLALLKAKTPFALTWARLFYMYGAGQNRASLYSQLMAAIDSQAASFRMSSGEQSRDYLPVAEVARRLAGLSMKVRDAGLVNVCSGRPVTVLALVDGWLQQRGAALRLERGYYPMPDYEPRSFWGATERLRALLSDMQDI